jgi:type I restriction enzyme M protein
MLDTDTKRRIDNARDILVGKVPDPKSQVEQITIALIYKFMDDMDAESEELGGKRKFFTGDYARYGWAKLMAPSLGGHEMIGLYGEGISKMPENPGIPGLFRDIFKNAFLPYRDPETLKAFLKVIDEFSYDHSERLGDAFEYLLSVLGSQGDAGQFRTPRHIIDFMVEVLAPKKGDVILDPACGTAGFLISAYKHILRANTDAKGHSKLTPDDRGRLAKNFKGYDISPDMVRLSLVNLYLHGFTDPHIYEYDTLTSEERWNEFADVILANPPFMSPTGGIRPHRRFSIQAKRSEVLFVDYMAEHLTPNGRAGIIVPEGIIFQSQNAYVALRKMLVETSLVAVISLPAGVFQPYSGVKTSILILDKSLAKQASTIAFFKVENDGFGLGAQRRAIEKNDLPQVQAELDAYLTALRSGASTDSILGASSTAQIVAKEKIAANGDYNLSGERYRENVASSTSHKLVPVGRFMREGVKTVDPRNTPDELFELWSIPAFDAGRPELVRGGEIGSQKKVVAPGDVLLSRIIPHIRRGWVVQPNQDGRRQVASTEWIVFSSDEVVPGFLRQLLVSDFFHASFMQTITGVGGSLSRANPAAVGEIQIPLPPLEVQKDIVAEIEGYQKVINGARAVVDHYRPHIPIRPDWPMVRLADVCETITDGDHQPPPKANDGVPFVTITNIDDRNELNFAKTFFVPESYYENLSPARKPRKGDILYSVTGSYGIPVMVRSDRKFCFQRHIAIIRPSADLNNAYLHSLLSSPFMLNQGHDAATGVAQKTVSLNSLRNFKIPLPPLATQRAIVAEIEAEQALVAANRELITRFEQKIQATLARIWGEQATASAESYSAEVADSAA